MNRRILAICDLETEYADRFADYLQDKKGLPFEVRVFSDASQLVEFCGSHEVGTILISEAAYCEQVMRLKEIHIIILNESGNIVYPEYLNVDKYQPAENIIREVMCYYTEKEEMQLPDVMTRTHTRLIGVYSPVKRSLQTTFALTLGQLMAKKSSVLYLNFESYSGFERILDRSFGMELSDLIYFCKHTKSKLLYRVESMIEKVGELNFVPPFFSVVDLNMISGEEWKELLVQLCEKCNYDYIILDLSDNMRGLFEILRMCETVYTTLCEDRMAEAKAEQYERLLKVSEYTDVLQKTKKCRLPQFHHLPVRMEQLVSGELAEYVKDLMKEEAYEEV